MKQYIIIGLIGVGVVGLGVVLALTANEDPADLPQLGEEVELQETKHIDPEEVYDAYNSNPPTSGPHDANALPWGIYPDKQEDERAVHALEHGGIWISYKDIDEGTLAELENIAQSNSGSVVLSPRPENDAKISVASWGRLEKLDTLDKDRINDFIKANKNKSPEPLAR